MSNEQNSSQNTSNTTASTGTLQNQQPSIKIQQNINKITTTNYQNRNNMFQVKKERRYVKANYMKNDNTGNVNKITATNGQNKSNMFRVKKERRRVKANYMKNDNTGNAIK